MKFAVLVLDVLLESLLFRLHAGLHLFFAPSKALMQCLLFLVQLLEQLFALRVHLALLGLHLGEHLRAFTIKLLALLADGGLLLFDGSAELLDFSFLVLDRRGLLRLLLFLSLL